MVRWRAPLPAAQTGDYEQMRDSARRFYTGALDWMRTFTVFLLVLVVFKDRLRNDGFAPMFAAWVLLTVIWIWWSTRRTANVLDRSNFCGLNRRRR